MRQRKRGGSMWGLVILLVITLLLMLGCGSNDEPFVLGACQLNDADCRLQ